MNLEKFRNLYLKIVFISDKSCTELLLLQEWNFDSPRKSGKRYKANANNLKFMYSYFTFKSMIYEVDLHWDFLQHISLTHLIQTEKLFKAIWFGMNCHLHWKK